MSELTTLSAKTLVQGIKNKTYSCSEVMQAYLCNIDQINTKFNAIV